jgi:hypothetical protein
MVLRASQDDLRGGVHQVVLHTTGPGLSLLLALLVVLIPLIILTTGSGRATGLARLSGRRVDGKPRQRVNLPATAATATAPPAAAFALTGSR